MIPIPPAIHEVLKDPFSEIEYQDRANKAMQEKDPKILACVEWLRQYGGYGGYGDYASYEYCQWMKENKRKGYSL